MPVRVRQPRRRLWFAERWVARRTARSRTVETVYDASPARSALDEDPLGGQRRRRFSAPTSQRRIDRRGAKGEPAACLGFGVRDLPGFLISALSVRRRLRMLR